MPSQICCESCGFDFADLPDRLDLTLRSSAGDAKAACLVLDGVASLRCPVCGEQVPLRVGTLEVIVRGKGKDASFFRWKRPNRDDATSPLIALGAFKVRLEAVTPIEPREICYDRVPVFVEHDGSLKVPSLPVRPEFFDCIDEVRMLERAADGGPLCELEGGQCHATLFLHGLVDPVTEVIRAEGATAGSITAESAYRELNLRVWPKLPTSDWGFFLVGLAGSGELGNALVNEGRVRVSVRGPDGSWKPLGSKQRAGTAVVDVFKERPHWLAIETVGSDGRVSAGGVFATVDGPASVHAPAGTLDLALDFGTSNSCVAVGHDDGPRLLAPVSVEDWARYALRGGVESTAPAGPDLWPSPAGFGPRRDVFPSELVFLRPMAELARAGTGQEWTFGIDYGIPAAGITPEFDEAEHVTRYFKWTALVPPSLNQLVEDLQTAYLHALLLQAYVRHAVASGTQPAVVNVQFSYPTCFDRDDLEKLERSMDRAASRLAGSTNVKWTCRSGVDESTAAVAATEPGGAEDSIGPGVDVKVILDMGGGSTDIVVQFPGAQEPIVYLTSVAYAGAALLDAFAGRREADGKRTSSCLGAGATVDTLQRRVRGATSFRDILSDPDLFHKSWLKVAANRTRHFYGYLIEYVARLLAAGILDGRFALKRDNHLKPQLAIGFFFFGQGWGFSSQLTEADPFKHVADEVMKRTKQLVGAERSEYALALRKGITGLSAVIGEVDRRRVPHAKAAVAVGLLKAPATDGRSAASQDRGRRGRSITGWAVKTGSEPDVPWFAYHTTEGDDPFGYAFRGRCTPWSGDGSADAQPLGDLFDQPADDQSVPMALRKATPWYRGLREAWIEWPCPQPELPRDLKGIEDLDPKTKGKRLQVLPGPCEGNEGKGNRGWFAKGPYEWLLERFFKPKLAEITN